MINEECKLALLEFGKLCVAVVGCRSNIKNKNIYIPQAFLTHYVTIRVSPDQKKEMVTLIKEGIDGVRTLAIGDGANDVAMIQVGFPI
jgi:magnesium-transporting ATPase (P-type)